MTVMSCRWHSPPSSQTGQSCGWLIISSSITRGAEAHRLVVVRSPTRLPARGSVMQAMTISPLLVVVVPEELDGALAAGADRAHGRVPAEVGQVVAQREADVEQVAAVVDLVAHALDRDGDGGHQRARSVAGRAAAGRRGAGCGRRARRRRPAARRAVPGGRRAVAAAAFGDVPLEVVAEQLAARCRAACVALGARSQKHISAPMNQHCSASRSRSLEAPAALLDVVQHVDGPGQARPAGRAPAARLLGEEAQQVEASGRPGRPSRRRAARVPVPRP